MVINTNMRNYLYTGVEYVISYNLGAACSIYYADIYCMFTSGVQICVKLHVKYSPQSVSLMNYYYIQVTELNVRFFEKD